MKYYAPNVTAIVGSEIAARLIALAGGLIPLSRMPSSTVQVPFPLHTKFASLPLSQR
jgi:RNA processing factor Prp31